METLDRMMMERCLDLSKASGKAGEYPYAAIICRKGSIVTESINRVMHDGDVTRHAEVVAISQAQKKLGTVSLDDCEIYAIAEPCVFCCYAIRGSRKWNVLGDTDLSTAMPEVFAPPPDIVSGYMQKESEQALIEWNPFIAEVIKQRGLFGSAPRVVMQTKQTRPQSVRDRVLQFLRRNLFDYFGRR